MNGMLAPALPIEPYPLRIPGISHMRSAEE